MPDGLTIAAIATPSGRGGIGVIRISGIAVRNITFKLLNKTIAPRYASYSLFYAEDGSVIDQGIALFFSSPHSFTGEDILELHAHGGPIVLDRLLQRILQLGAQLAKPGEFSERAFLNNKIDLAQAEAIADLINCSSEQAAKAALCSLQGKFSRCIQQLLHELVQLRMYVEASIAYCRKEFRL
jgi:tRNA modification GTPase